MKKGIGILVFLLFLGAFTACSGNATEEKTAIAGSETSLNEETQEKKTDIYVLAAASLTDVMGELIKEFELEYPEYHVIPSYGASGALQTQIEEGAPGDVFFSAAEKQMKALVEKGYVRNDSYTPLLENKVVLVTGEENPKNITSFSDMATEKVELVGLGEFETVPVGQYSEEILLNLGLLEGLLAEDKIVFASDVRGVLAWVESGEVDCGLVYKTDAAQSPVHIVEEAPLGSLETPVIYPMATLSHGENPQGGEAFLEYCKNKESGEKFIAYGFSLVEK